MLSALTEDKHTWLSNILGSHKQVFASNRWVTESTHGTQPRGFDGTFCFKPFLQTSSTGDEFNIIYINKFFRVHIFVDLICTGFFYSKVFSACILKTRSY